MQFLPLICPIADHNSKEIQCICAYPQCEERRYLCQQCLIEDSHQHNQLSSSHFINIKQFYNQLKNNFKLIDNMFSVKRRDFIEQTIGPIKIVILESQNLLMSINKIICQLEQALQLRNNIKITSQKLCQDNIIHGSLLNNLINQLFIDQDVFQQLEVQSNTVMQNVLRIKEWSQIIVQDDKQLVLQKIKAAKYQVSQIDNSLQYIKTVKDIRTGAISNNLKYIVSGYQNKLIKIWNYKNFNLIKSIKLNDDIFSSKFTDDSKIFYIGGKKLYQFSVNQKFKQMGKYNYSSFIANIYCISNSLLLASFYNGTIIKTDFNTKQQILQIQAHLDCIMGLDYNNNIIASGSHDTSIKLWSGFDGQLIIENKNAHKNSQGIMQVLFVLDYDQLISLDQANQIIIWNINYDTKQLEIYELIKGDTLNISLADQFIITTGQKAIKIYTIQGDLIRQLDYQIKGRRIFNIIQPQSMKAVLILGCQMIKICKLDID